MEGLSLPLDGSDQDDQNKSGNAYADEDIQLVDGDRDFIIEALLGIPGTGGRGRGLLLRLDGLLFQGLFPLDETGFPLFQFPGFLFQLCFPR